MTNQKKLQIAAGMIQGANLIKDSICKTTIDQTAQDVGLKMIRKSIRELLDEVQPGIVEIRREKSGVCSYTITPEVVPLIDEVDWSSL